MVIVSHVKHLVRLGPALRLHVLEISMHLHLVNIRETLEGVAGAAVATNL